MQVSVETTTGLERKLTVAIEEDRIAQVVDGRLQDMTKTVNIKGFRKGKVPLKVVKQHYGDQVRQEVMTDVLQSTFYEAVGQEKLQPAGAPRFDKMTGGEPGQGMEYTAYFEVYPEVSISDLSKETIEKPVVEISDADIDDMLETVRGQHKEFVTTDRAAKDGDQVNIDFVGSVDGVAFEGGEAKGVDLELGSGRMIKGFEEALVGTKAGDDITLNVTFPDDYHAKELAGKPAEFATHVNAVKEAQLPEIDDKFAERLGIKDPSVENMRSEIRKSMQQELDSRVKNTVKSAAMDALLSATSFDVPASLVSSESEALMQQMQQNLAQQGMQQAELKMDPSMFADQAEKRVRLGLIMQEIVKKEDIKADEDKVLAKVEELGASYEHPEQVKEWYYGDKQRLAEVQSLVMEEQVVDWVMEQADVSDKNTTFKEIMSPEPTK